MVRAVVGDEVQVEAQVDSIFASRKPVQVQLLVVVIEMIFLHFDSFEISQLCLRAEQH